VTQKYVILWYEDSKDFVDSLVDPIKEHVESLGFDFLYENKIDDTDLVEPWLKKIDPDLILVDYGLGGGTKGDQVLEKIKAIEPFAEIVFYSKNYEDYIKKISRKMDGVFFTIRKDLLSKTTNVINKTVRKQQEPNNMRGVIIAEAIDIERRMEKIILICLGVDSEREKVIKKVIDPEEEILTFKKKSDLVNKICKERILALKRAGSTAVSPKKEAIQALITEISAKKKIFETAEDEVVKIRNVMAHAIQDEKTGCLKSYIIKSNPITVDDNFCKTTRTNLKKHCTNLDDLTNLLSQK
jgi:hypothetical protein